ncbi:MAG: hypothetical protein U0797_01970 [Gemmataceae bacterium]
MAVVVYVAGRSRSGPVAAGAGALLASLALGPWLGVHPGLFSCLLLALTLVLLGRAAEAAEGGSQARGSWWLLPALAVVWANTDVWAPLGPVAAVLVALGEWLRGRARAARWLATLFVLMAGASLVSPNHLRGVSFLAEALRSGPAGGPALSPFWIGGFAAAPASALAFYALTALGVLALVDRHGPGWSLAPLWGVLFGLTAWRPAAAPLFAVVAGPAAAAGLAVLTRRASADGVPARWSRRLGVVAGGLLVLAAWPGWLQGQAHGRREWSVGVDDSLRDAVGLLDRWRHEGKLGAEARGLTLSPDGAAYWAYFAPAEGLNLERLPPLSAQEAGVVLEGLLGGGDTWRELLRGRQVRYLLLANSAAQPAAAVFTRLAAAPDEWPLLYLRGRTVVFGWRDPHGSGKADPLAALSLDLERRAFRPGAEDRAPDDSPEPGPEPRPWWRAFVEPAPPPPPGRDEADLYLALFDARRPRFQGLAWATWLGRSAAGLVSGLADAGRGPAALGWETGLRLAWVQLGWGNYLAGQDDGPPGLLLLAVRAARRAVRDNPDDARSHFLLGEAYLRLAHATRERDWRAQLPPFERVRQAQAIAAYTRTLALRPGSVEAHGRLTRIYRDGGSLDLALRHLEGLARAARSRGPRAGEDRADFDKRVASLEEERDALQKEVAGREGAWREVAGGRKVLDQARDAMGRGLPGLALETLLKSDASEFGAEGSLLELELLLLAGRVKDVKAWADPELQASLGAAAYHELLARLAAATGDYDGAERHLAGVASAAQHRAGRSRPAREEAALNVTRALLLAPVAAPSPATLVPESLLRHALLDDVRQAGGALRWEANAYVIQGLIALEAGQVERSGEAMRRALAGWGGPEVEAAGGGVDFSGRSAAQDVLRWLGER